MQSLFYHAAALCCVSAIGCGRPAPQPSSAAIPAAPSAPFTSSTPLSPAATPTAEAIANGRALIERVRAAGGGPALTALRSFELIGTSAMSGTAVNRSLIVRALFPQYFWQEEATPATLKGTPFHTIVGLADNIGWVAGARLAGDGQSQNPNVQKSALTRAARQAMSGFLGGINAPWLTDTGRYTVTDGGVINAGPDRGALVLVIDGPDGRTGRLLIDPGTHLPRRLIEPPQTGGGGTASVADIVFTYSDYQPQAGLQLPHTIVRENGQHRTVWSIAQYKLNPRLTPKPFMRAPR